MSVCYLSTLMFDDQWLDAVREQAPDVEILQVPAVTFRDVPDEVWARVHVLHTSSVLPPRAAAPKLRWVQLDTSGVDHVIGTDVWAAPDVDITTIGGVSPVPLAEYVLFAILGFSHRLPHLIALQQQRAWPAPATRFAQLMPQPLAGATVGIIGYGRIGRQIARFVRVHGMSVIGVSRSGRPPAGAREDQFDFAVDHGGATVDGAAASAANPENVEIVGPAALPEVLGRCDFVVVVVPLTDETRNLLDRAAIAAIKPGAVLINVARGGVVDEVALRDALDSGALAGAVLDVFDTEPLTSHSAWWSAPNVFLTPHVSGLAPRYAELVQQIVVENLRRFVAGRPLVNRVDRARAY